MNADFERYGTYYVIPNQSDGSSTELLTISDSNQCIFKVFFRAVHNLDLCLIKSQYLLVKLEIEITLK